MKKVFHMFVTTAFVFSLSVIQSCSKFIEVDSPSTNLNGENVYSTDATAIAVLTDIYSQLSSRLRSGSLASVSIISALSADELTLFDGVSSPVIDYIPYYQNALTPLNTGSIDFCERIYNTVYVCNTAIESISNRGMLSSSVLKQLSGEALFVRALCYFYLVNLYGPIPLVISTDYKINNGLAKSTVEQVYKQIVDDLTKAQLLLSHDYLGGNLSSPTVDRVRPTYWAATALLARTYLYINDYKNAVIQSSSIISNTALFDTVDIEHVFKQNSKEAIWQLQPVAFTAGGIARTQEADLLMLPQDMSFSFNEHPVYLSTRIAKSFEVIDKRQIFWIDSANVDGKIYYFPTKYRSFRPDDPADEYSVVFRLAEQYLIRAESRAYLNDFDGAISDINVIRLRAGLELFNSTQKESILAEIVMQRKLELFTEWGHRWLDLKRTKMIDQIMDGIITEKDGKWKSEYQFYPFSQNDIQRNPKLIQNPGY